MEAILITLAKPGGGAPVQETGKKDPSAGAEAQDGFETKLDGNAARLDEADKKEAKPDGQNAQAIKLDLLVAMVPQNLPLQANVAPATVTDPSTKSITIERDSGTADLAGATALVQVQPAIEGVAESVPQKVSSAKVADKPLQTSHGPVAVPDLVVLPLAPDSGPAKLTKPHIGQEKGMSESGLAETLPDIPVRITLESPTAPVTPLLKAQSDKPTTESAQATQAPSIDLPKTAAVSSPQTVTPTKVDASVAIQVQLTAPTPSETGPTSSTQPEPFSPAANLQAGPLGDEPKLRAAQKGTNQIKSSPQPAVGRAASRDTNAVVASLATNKQTSVVDSDLLETPGFGDKDQDGGDISVDKRDDDALMADLAKDPIQQGVGPVKDVKIEAQAKVDVVRHVREAVADTIRDLVEARRPGQVVLRLQPDDLGTVTVVVKTLGPRVDASVTASDPGLRASLAQHHHELAASVERRGLQMGTFTVGHENASWSASRDAGYRQQQHRPMTEDFERVGRLANPTPSATTPAATPYATVAIDNVDYRV